MKRVKIIEASGPLMLEKKVNEWLEGHDKDNVLSVQYSTCNAFSACIVFVPIYDSAKTAEQVDAVLEKLREAGRNTRLEAS